MGGGEGGGKQVGKAEMRQNKPWRDFPTLPEPWGRKLAVVSPPSGCNHDGGPGAKVRQLFAKGGLGSTSLARYTHAHTQCIEGCWGSTSTTPSVSVRCWTNKSNESPGVGPLDPLVEPDQSIHLLEDPKSPCYPRKTSQSWRIFRINKTFGRREPKDSPQNDDNDKDDDEEGCKKQRHLDFTGGPLETRETGTYRDRERIQAA